MPIKYYIEFRINKKQTKISPFFKENVSIFGFYKTFKLLLNVYIGKGKKNFITQKKYSTEILEE